MGKVCLGLLVVFFCEGEPKPAVVSDFCQIAAEDVRAFSRLTEAEIAALTRPRKEAIVRLKRKYKKLCK